MITAAASSTKAYWYLTRGTGLVALILLTASVVLGIVTTVRWKGERWPRFVVAALHRNISLLVTAFLAVHIATSVMDSFAPIHWIDAIVPGVSVYRPLWLGLGALSADLFIAVAATSLLRRWIGHGVWRAVHWVAYLSWPLAVVHGLGTGTDTRVGVVQILTLLCVLAVLGAIWWRIAATPISTDQRALALLASVAVPAAMMVWAAVGPLRPGWASRAGTPASLLPKSIANASNTQSRVTPNTVTPNTVTPNTVTPNTVTPTTVTPNLTPNTNGEGD
jgi:methionine sulfoxide reductase heme-binding subunit